MATPGMEVLFHASPMGVGFSVNRVLCEVNDRLCEMTGYAREELIGQSLRMLHPSDAAFEAVGRALYPKLAEQSVVRVDAQLKRKDGRILDVALCLALVDPEAPARGVIATVLDVTERKAAEEALAELNRTLEQRVAERTAEVGRQAEQLRALATQLTRTEQQERTRLAGVLHDHIQQLIVAAQMQVNRMGRAGDAASVQAARESAAEVLQQALEASRSLTVELCPPVLHESGLVPALQWLAGRMLSQQGLRVRVEAAADAEPDGDELRFLCFECARELLRNVAKHAGVAEAEVALLRSAVGDIHLCVSDAGCGFEPARLREQQPEEMSFGLFSIQERLKYIGGWMTLASVPGQGTQVTLVLPAATAPQPSAATAAATRARNAAVLAQRTPATCCRVLIVDDHHIVRDGLAGLLQAEPDIEVVGAAADGTQAIALAAELLPDVIVMDINLGSGIDGVEATRCVLARSPGIRVIGLSMHSDRGVADAMREAGATAYLTKGGPPEDLIEAIRLHGAASWTRRP